jgi:hypothetical protein
MCLTRPPRRESGKRTHHFHRVLTPQMKSCKEKRIIELQEKCDVQSE